MFAAQPEEMFQAMPTVAPMLSLQDGPAAPLSYNTRAMPRRALLFPITGPARMSWQMQCHALRMYIIN